MQICCESLPSPPSTISPRCVREWTPFAIFALAFHSLWHSPFLFFCTPKERGSHADYNRNDMKMFSVACGKKGEKKDENRGGNVKRRRWQQESVAYLRAPATRKKMAPGKAENERWKEPARLPLSDNVCPSALQISLLERKNNVLFDCGQQMQFTFVGAAEWFLPKDIKKGITRSQIDL